MESQPGVWNNDQTPGPRDFQSQSAGEPDDASLLVRNHYSVRCRFQAFPEHGLHPLVLGCSSRPMQAT